MTVGRLAITVAAGRPAEIAATAVPTERLFVGRPPEEVARLLPSLFAVCGEAQGVACQLAVEAALGVAVDDDVRAERRLRVVGEGLREHLLRIAVDWAAALGEAPDREALRAVAAHVAALRAATPGAAEALAAFVRDTILGGGLAGLADESAFAAWAAAGRTVAQRLVAHVIRSGFADSGAAEPAVLPALPADAGSTAFPIGGLEPLDTGPPYETTAFAEARSAPLVAALEARHGAGLLARLAARLVAVAALAGEAVALAGAARGGRGPDLRQRKAGGSGVGEVETARGRLRHVVEVAEGRVRRYHIAAPTDWNFSPAGPVRAALSAIAGDGRGRIEERARLMIGAFDPCVDYVLKVA